MLELTQEEQWSLQIVCLECKFQKQKQTGASFNYKKTGLSRASYVNRRLKPAEMTPRAAAAFQFLQDKNKYYEYFLYEHNRRLDNGIIGALSSYDLFILSNSIEAAIRPYRYPTIDFTDTDILGHYHKESEDYTHRVVSIGLSWNRKRTSSVRVYAENPRFDLLPV